MRILIRSQKQAYDILFTGKVPTIRANTLDILRRQGALLSIATFTIGLAHRSSPGVQPTIYLAMGRLIVVTETRRIFPRRRLQGRIVEVLGHPPLVANLHRLVGLAIALVRQGSIFADIFRFCLAKDCLCNRAGGFSPIRTRRLHRTAGLDARRRVARRTCHEIATVVTTGEKEKCQEQRKYKMTPQVLHISFYNLW